MADNKITLQIAASGGDAAAADFRKVEAAVDTLAGTRGGKGLKSLTEEAGKFTRSGVQMGTGMQNVGYQMQDLAVQIGSGTSAFRALGQQLPQLLSGFGPMGILLGTVSAVALPLAGAMFGLGNATETAGEKAAEAAEKLKKLSEARTGKAISAALKDNEAYLQSLDDENAAINRNNESMQRSIDLIKAQQNAKVAVQNAQAALDLAELDADDSKTEAEKIQGRAKINRRVERERFENEREQAGFRVNGANNNARGATGEADRSSADLEAARQRLASQEADRKSLKGRVFAADSAKEQLPQVEEDLARAQAPLPFIQDPKIAAAAQSQAAKDIARLQTNQAALQAKIYSVTGDDRKNLSGLDGADGKSGTIAQTKKAVEDLTVVTKNLADAAAKAREDAENTQRVESVGLESQFEVSKRRLAANSITANSGAAKAVAETARAGQRTEQAQLREARQAAADALRERARANAGTLGNDPRANSTRNQAGANALKDLGKDIGSADTDAEIKAARDKIVASQSMLGASLVSAMNQMLTSQEALLKKVQVLEGRIKNSNPR